MERFFSLWLEVDTAFSRNAQSEGSERALHYRLIRWLVTGAGVFCVGLLILNGVGTFLNAVEGLSGRGPTSLTVWLRTNLGILFAVGLTADISWVGYSAFMLFRLHRNRG